MGDIGKLLSRGVARDGMRLDAKLPVDLEAMSVGVLDSLPGLGKRFYVLAAPGDLSLGQRLRF
jgi:hypothetical protein